MANIKLTPAIQGEKEFRCYVCNKELLQDIAGECRLKLQCPRCKTTIVLTMAKPLPAALAVRNGELVKI